MRPRSLLLSDLPVELDFATMRLSEVSLPWPSWFCLSIVRGYSEERERRLTVFEFSGNTRANARVLSAATRG